MKKTLAIFLGLLLVCSAAIPALAEYVDVYTSASVTKTTLEGEAYDAAIQLLAENSADMATRAEADVEGYQEPESALGNIMSVNPDGSVGLSTISQWQLIPVADGADSVFIQLTYGQNALNLLEVGTRASLLVKIENLSYIIHLNVVDVYEQVFTQEAYDAGEFNAHYSGSGKELSSYDILFEVLSIESTGALMF